MMDVTKNVVLFSILLLFACSSPEKDIIVGEEPTVEDENENNEDDEVQTPNRPNMIFYLADDQDILDFGCYGNASVNTPIVDQLATEGMKFSHAFTGQAICAPSRSQLYTGLYPVRNGCYTNHISARPEIKSIAHYLKDAGYDVILAGKSHVNPSSVFDWSDSWIDIEEEIDGEPHPRIPITRFKEYVRDNDKPFCIFFASHYPHGPFINTGKYTIDDIEWYPYFEKVGESKNKKIGYYHNIDVENEELKELLEFVDSEEKLDSSVFIYSSDHGSSGKYTTYNCGLNVPFVVRWKGVIEAGSSSQAMIHYTDVVPTFLDMAGASIPDDFDGKSFLSVLKGETDQHHEMVFGVDHHQNLLGCYIFPSRMAMNREYKYIRNYNSIEVYEQNLGDDENINIFIKRGAEEFSDTPYEELYDLVNDPYELTNLIADPTLTNIKEDLIVALNDWMVSQNDFLLTYKMPLIKSPNNPLDEASKSNDIPPELEGILQDSEYMPAHY